MKILVNNPGINSHDIKICVGEKHEVTLSAVRSVNYQAEVGTFPFIDVNLFAMTDQEFEIANEHCKIEISADNLAAYPTQMLKKELERRDC